MSRFRQPQRLDLAEQLGLDRRTATTDDLLPAAGKLGARRERSYADAEDPTGILRLDAPLSQTRWAPRAQRTPRSTERSAGARSRAGTATSGGGGSSARPTRSARCTPRSPATLRSPSGRSPRTRGCARWRTPSTATWASRPRIASAPSRRATASLATRPACSGYDRADEARPARHRGRSSDGDGAGRARRARSPFGVSPPASEYSPTRRRPRRENLAVEGGVT